MLRRVDLRHQPVDHHVGVRHQRDRVAGHHGQAADVLGQVDQHGEVVGCGGVDDVARLDAGVLGGLQLRPSLLPAGQPPPPQAVLAQSRYSPKPIHGSKKTMASQARQVAGFSLRSTTTGSITSRIAHSLASSSCVQERTFMPRLYTSGPPCSRHTADAGSRCRRRSF